MAHCMSPSPPPSPTLNELLVMQEEGSGARPISLLTDFIEGAERPRQESPEAPLRGLTGSEAEMDTSLGLRGPTLTMDERSLPGSTSKAAASLGMVEMGDGHNTRRLVLASTSPTYTPPPLGGLHPGLRMVVADLSQTYSPPPVRACGDQWRGPDYVPSPVAELERLEARKCELEA